MSGSALQLLSESSIRAALRQAWLDSAPGETGGHEEGGFILRDNSGNMHASRWPTGSSDEIRISSHQDCRFEECEIIATFHTHPNTGRNYRQEPSEIDMWSVRDDPNLKAPWYLGEFVISEQLIYVIDPRGRAHELGGSADLLFAK